MSRKLYLHIGHGKTGTSFVQSCLALSRDALAAANIHYPAARGDRQAAAGEVSSGNGGNLAASLAHPQLRRQIAVSLRRSERDVLYSSEFLFHHMGLMRSAEGLLDFADHAGFDEVEILMLIRDPLDHIRSAYLQNVQRGGVTEPIDAMAQRFNMPMRANQLALSFDDPHIGLTVKNYSRMRAQLIETTEMWLGLPAGALRRPGRERVNRSLTAAEMEIQRVFNEQLGPSGDIFADAVVGALPDLPADYPALSDAARAVLHDRCANAMRRLNRIIPEDQAYRFDILPAPGAAEERDDDFVTLTSERIEVIFGAIATRLRL